MDNTTISCAIDVYNKAGTHAFIDNAMDFDGEEGDFKISILPSTNETGTYGYIIHCNNSEYGGFVATSFDITPTGYQSTEAEALIMGFLFLVVIIIWLLCLIFFNTINDK